MASIDRMRFEPVWLMAFALVSCGSRTEVDNASQIGDPTTGSVGAGAGMSGGGMIAGGGAQGGAPGAGGVGGSGETGGSGVTGGVGGSGAKGGSGGSGGAGGAGGTTPDACPCTRRPGSSALYCPIGSDGSSFGKITTDGGGVGLGSFFILVPRMALPSMTTFVVHETTIPPPVDYVDFSPITVVAPQIATLAPVTVTIKNVMNAPGVPRTAVAIYAAKDQYSPFTRVEDSRFENDVVRGSVSQIGAYFAGYPKSADQANCP
jgi:hypothetical protein